MKSSRVAKLSIALSGDEPPREFRLFVAGWNDTSKGAFLFDATAAQSVMAAYEQHGADVMIDLEHLSLESPAESRGFDPDARGWAKLELRADGSLWAVEVRWTPDGAARLRERRQRYVSPALTYNAETRRVEELFNVAITAMPATHQTPALVAASRRARLAGGGRGMSTLTLDELMKVAKALGMDGSSTVADVMAKIGGEPPVEAPAEEAPVEEPAPDAAMADAPAEEPAPEEMPAEMIAASARLVGLTGKVSLSDAVREVEAWRASHIELEAGRAKLAAERRTLEAAERRRLTVALVTDCGEAPATAWADDAASKPAEPWASMPVEALRARVAKLSRKGAPPEPKPPPSGGKDEHGLDERELAICKDTGCEPATFAALKARRTNSASAH